LLFDEVQCGLGRSGDWNGWDSLAPDVKPDAVSWAKGIAGGFPLGAIWVSARPVQMRSGEIKPLCDLLGPGSHGTTFGGTPLICAGALEVLAVIEEEHLLENARAQGERALASLEALASPWIREVRGVGLLLGIIFLAIEPLEGTLAILPYIVGPAIGVYIPILYVKNRRNQRVSEIRRIFPDALEMLALCNEASMTIDMALSKIARELEKKYPVISEEFFIIGIELALLDSRAKAFDGFYKRFPLDEVRSFVTTVNQAERTGTPMAQSIRALAKEMRKDNIANIQARLESLGAKLVLPLILFFFVPVIIFMFMPILMRVNLSGM
jgi:hypothetical protein